MNTNLNADVSLGALNAASVSVADLEFQSKAPGAIDRLATAIQNIASYSNSTGLSEVDKEGLADMARALSIQRVAIQMSAGDSHTDTSDSDKLKLIENADSSVDTVQAFLRSSE